jgi:hypothetical protein
MTMTLLIKDILVSYFFIYFLVEVISMFCDEVSPSQWLSTVIHSLEHRLQIWDGRFTKVGSGVVPSSAP